MSQLRSILPSQKPTNWGFALQLTFGLMQWFSLARALFIQYFGDQVNALAAALNGISVVMLIMAVGWYLRKYGNPLSGAARIWMFIVAGLTVICTIRGFGGGLIPKFVILDVLAFASLLCFVFIGSIPQAFDDLRRVWFYVLMLSIPLNLLAMADLSGFTSELTSGVRVARETISYRTHNTLDVVLLVGAFAFTLRPWQRVVVVIGFCQVIAMQVLYQKRLETVYYAFAALFCLWVWWIESGAWRAKLRDYVRGGVITSLAIVCMVLALKGNLLVPQAVALFERTTGRSRDVDFKGGAANYFFIDNERFQIVLDSLSTMSVVELIFGRGMGGGVEWTGFNTAVLDSLQSEEVWASYYMEDYDYFGRRAFEIGAATPILKGGIIFWLVIYTVYLLFFLRIPQISRSLAGRLCIVIVMFQLPYAFFGGDFNVTAIFQMGNYAACLGMGLASYASREGLVGQNLQALRNHKRFARVPQGGRAL